MLKPFYFTLLLGGLFSWCASAKNNKPKNEEPVQKSINIGAHLVGGSEIGPSFRTEYENSNWGKIIASGQYAIYHPLNKNVMMDIGIGYGYPVLYLGNKSLFVNGLFTGALLTHPDNNDSKFGASGLAEIEYRHRWSNFSFCVAHTTRLLHSSDYEIEDKLITFSWGIKVGIIYSLNFMTE